MKELSFLKSNFIAHRGLHNQNIPENTLMAFYKAITNKYIIELDIHMLSDKTIVVYHDYNLIRLTGKNKIVETLSYEQLSKIKIQKMFTIPTLKQVMNIVAGKVPIIIEIKDVDNNSEFEEELINILDMYHGCFAIQSANPFVIEWFLKNKKNYIVGIVIINNINYKVLKKYIKKVDFISVNKKMLPLENNKNKTILGWTITTLNEYNKYIKYCDNLICEKFI